MRLRRLIVKLNVGYTSLAFVSCHLAAHSHKLHQRNLNCREVRVPLRLLRTLRPLRLLRALRPLRLLRGLRTLHSLR